MTAALHLLNAVYLGASGLALVGRGLAVIGPLAVPPVALLGVVFGVGLVLCCVGLVVVGRKGRE